jgi:hypothetical protein
MAFTVIKISIFETDDVLILLSTTWKQESSDEGGPDL